MKAALLFCLFFSSLFADIEDYFKPSPNKSAGSTVRNIDFIYMINLDQRPEKFAKAQAQLSLYGIEPYRFSAVNGWELSLETINDVGVTLEPWMAMGRFATYYEAFMEQHEIVHQIGRTYFCHCMSRGAIGIALSHLSILQDAFDSGYERIWVMEDDIDVHRDPHLLSQLIDQLDILAGPDGWDILFTDPDTKNQQGEYVPCTGYAWRPNFTPADPAIFAERVDVGDDFKRIGARFGAYSMIVNRSGMKKILDFIKAKSIYLPFDMDFCQPPGIRLFALKYDLVSTQPKAPSDNGLPTYGRGTEGL